MQTIIRGIAALITVAAVVAAPAADSPADRKPVVRPAAEVQWTDHPSIKGARTAVLWGDPKSGAYGALRSLPGGTSLPLHTHSSDERVVVLSGTISLSFEGEAARDLPAGSYAFVPAGLKHSAICKAGPDCVYFAEQPGKGDFKLVN
jgi:quercetin dioxygenase-like cupin family protein